MTLSRPKSMTVLSILNFIFGGLGILFAMTGIVTASSMMSNPLAAEANHIPQDAAQLVAMSGLVTGFLSFAVGGLAIVSGVGLMQIARWSRGWALGYAIAAIANCVIALLVALLVVQVTTQSAHASNGTNSNAEVGIKTGIIVAIILVKCIYPMVFLFFLRSTKWKEAFSKATPGNA